MKISFTIFAGLMLVVVAFAGSAAAEGKIAWYAPMVHPYFDAVKKGVEAFEKEAGSKISRMVSSMVSQRLVDRILKDERGYIDEKIYLDYLVLIIAQIADEGDVVVLGRGSLPRQRFRE